jgi:hypothetical protein
MGEERNVYKVLVGKAGRKATIIILWHRWKDKIKMDLRETGWGGVDSVGSGQDWQDLVYIVMYLWVLAPQS